MKTEKKQAIYNRIITKAIQGAGEKVAADGGALVNDEIVDVIDPNFMKGSLYERCMISNVSNTGIILPRYDTDTQDTIGTFGANAYWVKEGDALTDSTIEFDNANLKLRKLAVKIPITEEISQDVEFLPHYISKVGGQALKNKIDFAIIYGDSDTSMGGITNTAEYATLYTTAGVNYIVTMQTMVGGYYGGAEGTWVLSQDVWASILSIADSSKVISYDGPNVYMFGYPVQILPLADTECLVLADFSQYAIIQKELRKDISEHVLFDTDQSEVRLIARLQGAPIWSTAMILENGEYVSAFVAIESMNNDGYSSSSSI